jgi:cytidylate kinase
LWGLEQFLAPLNDRLERVARNSGAEIVNPFDSLCRRDECPAVRFQMIDNSFVDDVLRP